MSKKEKYPGELGRRSDDLPPKSPVHSVLGAPSEQSDTEYREATHEWLRRHVLREMEGIKLLLEFYKIEESEDQYFHLAMALARNHVPYFMKPARGRGRPKSKLQSLVFLIDGLAKSAKSAGLPQSSVYKTFAEILELEAKTIEREVKRFRGESEQGKKEK